MTTKLALLQEFEQTCRAAQHHDDLTYGAYYRIGAIGIDLQKKIDKTLADDSISDIELEDLDVENTRAFFKASLLAQIWGEHKKAEANNKADQLGPRRPADLRNEQNLTKNVIQDKVSTSFQPILASLKNTINYQTSRLEQSKPTIRTINLPGTNVEITTRLTSHNEGGFRQTDTERVPNKITQIAQEMGVDHFISVPLGQGNQAEIYPHHIDKDKVPANLTEFGQHCYRGVKNKKQIDGETKETGIDAAIIKLDDKSDQNIGFMSAISGAAFGLLVEVNDDGNAIKTAQVFLGPNNLYGDTKSIIKTTLEKGKFDLSKTHFYAEHGEGDMFAAEGTKYDKYGDQIKQRYSSKLAKIRPNKKSPKFARLGQQIFDINEAIRAEAEFCGLSTDKITINTDCPSATGFHASNTLEQSLIPGKFQAPDSPQDHSNLMLWPRNGYFTTIKNKKSAEVKNKKTA